MERLHGLSESHAHIVHELIMQIHANQARPNKGSEHSHDDGWLLESKKSEDDDDGGKLCSEQKISIEPLVGWHTCVSPHTPLYELI